MLTEHQIEQFYKDVDNLKLKFPNAEISRATKESTGNVSKILNRVIEPSEAFLEKFYKNFKITVPPVLLNTGVTNSPSSNDKYIQMMEKMIANLERENERLKKLVDVSLADIRNRQMEVHSEVKGGLKYQTEVIVKGDQKKLTESLEKINTYAGGYLAQMIEAGKKIVDGN